MALPDGSVPSSVISTSSPFTSILIVSYLVCAVGLYFDLAAFIFHVPAVTSFAMHKGVSAKHATAMAMAVGLSFIGNLLLTSKTPLVVHPFPRSDNLEKFLGEGFPAGDARETLRSFLPAQPFGSELTPGY